MQLSDLVRALRRSWVFASACLLVTISVSAGTAVLTTPKYTSSTQLFVAIQNSGSTQELQQGNIFSQARMRSYTSIVKTPLVLQPAIDRLGLSESSADLASRIDVRADNNTVLITLSVTDESPAMASALAEAVGVSLISAIEDLERSSAEGPSPVRLSVVKPADIPTHPASPNTRLYLVVGAALGLIFGLTSVVIRSRLDTKIRGEADLPDTITVLGGVAFDADAVKKPLLTEAGHQSPRAEAFRQIRTNMQFASVSSQSKSILVTSSLPGEGKSTTATNIAIAMAQAGQRVVLVDADLRRPSVAEYLGLESGAGLTTALVGAARVEDLIQEWGEDNLCVLTAGQIPPNPSELLGTEAMAKLLQELQNRYDVVIIDAPPLIPVTDASVLAQMVGGVVLVVGALKVKTQDLDKSLSALNLVGSNILGLVINLLPTKGPDSYAYSYYSYESKPDRHPRVTKTATTLNGSHLKSGRRSQETSATFDAVIRDR